MALDVRKLGVTLRSTSGTMAYAEEIFDETQGKFQSVINQELKTSIGNVSVPVQGVKGGDKILSLTDKNLSATLTLTYEQKTGDTAKKIYLNGIGGATIASIDATDFIKDKVVSSAELVETAETGVTIATPYIKLIFNDASTPVRFSVKSLVDVYTGANLKLSSAYLDTDAAETLKKDVSVDAAFRNIDTRLTTVEGKTYVDSIGGKKGAITLASGSTTAGAVNFSISDAGKISATTVLTGYAKTADISNTYATKTDLSTVQNAVKDAGDNATSALTRLDSLEPSVAANTAEIAKAVNTVTGDTYVKATKASKGVTLATTVHAVSSATKDADGLATAFSAKSYTDTKVADLKKTVDAINTAYLTATAVSDSAEYDEWDVLVGKSTTSSTSSVAP